MIRPVLFFVFLFIFSCGEHSVRKARYWKKTVVREVSAGRLLSSVSSGGRLLLQYERLRVLCRFVNENSLHLRAEWGTRFSSRPSYAVVRSRPVRAAVVRTNGEIRLVRGREELRVDPARMQLHLYRSGKAVFSTRTNAWTLQIREDQVFKGDIFHRILGSSTNFRFHAAGGGRYFGLGEKTGKMELTGRSFQFWNSDTYKYKRSTDPIYTSIPFYHCLRGKRSYSMFTECMARGGIALGKEVVFWIDDRRMDHYLFAGKPQKTLVEYTELTGRSPMPPLWALGFHQSRYSYMSGHEVRSVVSNFRKNGLPLDAVYLDLGFMDRNRSFTWNRKTYPDPAKMNRQLGKLGVRSVAIVDPGIGVASDYPVYGSGKRLNLFVKRHGRDFVGRVWPGNCVFPDFTLSRARRWWGNQYRTLLKIGVSGIWNDMNEPSVFGGPGGTMHGDVRHHYEGAGATHRQIHNVYGLQLMRATYEGLRRLRPRRRPFILTRAGYAGMQRYAFLWTGDNTADWNHLRMNLSMVVNLGLSGVPFSGADIGGYTGSPDGELFTRWIQLGTFMPFMRDHTEAGTKYQEPYVFKKHLHIIRKFMRLRYRMLPYLQQLSAVAVYNGTPLVRPMFWEFGEASAGYPRQFMLGDALLVAPVLEKGARKKRLFLPGGYWYSLDGDLKRIAGRSGKVITVKAPLDRCPLFVRGGTILPLSSGVLMSTMEYGKMGGLELLVCPGKTGNASGRFVIDDGLQNGSIARYAAACFIAGDKAAIQVKCISGGRGRVSGFFRSIRFRVPAGVRKVRVNGEPVPLRGRIAHWRVTGI